MSAVTGSARAWLRFEGAATLVVSVALYRETGASWLVFALLFLAPDLSMLGYLGGSRAGAAVYNTAHSYVLPLLLLLDGLFLRHPLATAPYALVWTAHIGMDRGLGYGLKYPWSFGETHLGKIGKAKQTEAEPL